MGPCGTLGNCKPWRQYYHAGHRGSGLAYRVQLDSSIAEWSGEYQYSTALGASSPSPAQSLGSGRA
eukprot:6645375-Pyramimonas_sp.AAC.1